MNIKHICLILLLLIYFSWLEKQYTYLHIINNQNLCKLLKVSLYIDLFLMVNKNNKKYYIIKNNRNIINYNKTSLLKNYKIYNLYIL
jgi:hypothetical protein